MVYGCGSFIITFEESVVNFSLQDSNMKGGSGNVEERENIRERLKKHNFFLEPLAKTGAGEKYQLFGQIGLDHGPEWYHGKFTDISTTFEKPTYSRSVYVANAADIGKTTG